MRRIQERLTVVTAMLLLLPAIVGCTGGQSTEVQVKGAAENTATTAVEQSKSLTEKEKIESLIKHIGSLKDVKFVRNGTAYSSDNAAEFLRRKWETSTAKVKTAKDFIEHVATMSSTTGQPYLIRFKDGKEMKSSEYLRGELEKLEKK
jgi:hypothetical protein